MASKTSGLEKWWTTCRVGFMPCHACIIIIVSDVMEKRKKEQQNRDLPSCQFATLFLAMLADLLARPMIEKQLYVLISTEHLILGEVLV